MMNGLDLFSGIGGITLALSRWIRPVCYVEIEPYCQSVLKTRFKSGDLPEAPIWDDVRTFDGSPFRGMVDIIYGGFPCQDISRAGDGEGLEAERSGLFFQIMRLAEEIRPSFIFMENVPAIRTRGLDRVGKELAGIGYDCRWDIISAGASVGAPHERKRWFLLAYSGSSGLKDIERSQIKKKDGKQESIGNTVSKSNWDMSIESGLVRVVYELPFAVDRIKSLGNAVVPAQVSEAFKRLMGLKETT